MWISRQHYEFLRKHAEKNINAENEIAIVKENQKLAVARAMEEYSTVLKERDELRLRVTELENQYKNS